VFSAPRLQKWQEWRERQFEARINQRFGPLVSAHEAAQVAEQERREVQTLVSQQRQILATLEQDPVFVEHKKDVVEFMRAKDFKNVTLHEAYAHVLATKVIPHLRSTGQSQAEAAMRTQAAASGLKPSATAPVVPGNAPRSFTGKGSENLKW
jgi:hypothetical protein